MAISPTVANANYRPAGTQNQFQKLDLYVPTTTAPDDGYPVLIRVNFSSFVISEKDGFIDGGVHQAFYDAGFAVADITVTVYPLYTSYSPAGGGMFWRPSDSDWDIEGGGHDIPQLDTIWAIQWLKQNAATYNLDTSEFFGWGASAGSVCIAFAGTNTDLSDAGSSIPQCTQDTTLKALILEISQGWVPAWVQNAGVGTPTFPSFYGMRKDGATSSPCINLGDAVADSGESSHAEEFSYNWRIAQTANRTANSTRPFYLRAGPRDPGDFAIGAVDYSIDADTLLPNMTGTGSTGLIDIHDAAFAVITRKQLNALSPFHQDRTRLTSLKDWTVSGISPDALVTASNVGSDMVSWATSQLGDLSGEAALLMRMDWRTGFQTLCAGLQTSPRNGMIQRRATHTARSKNGGRRAVRRWRLAWGSASAAEFALLLETWKATRGGAGPLAFTPPNQGVIPARFVGDSLRVSQAGPRRFAMSVEIEEFL